MGAHDSKNDGLIGKIRLRRFCRLRFVSAPAKGATFAGLRCARA